MVESSNSVIERGEIAFDHFEGPRRIATRRRTDRCVSSWIVRDIEFGPNPKRISVQVLGKYVR